MDDTSTHNGAVVPTADAAQWQQAAASLDAVLQHDTNQERQAWHWKLVAGAVIAWGLGSTALAAWAVVARPDVVPMVQFVHVDAQGVAQMVGDPVGIMDYTPQDGQWIQMLEQWVMRLRWRGVDEPQAQQAWVWLEMYSCGAARQQLQVYIQDERPMEHLGVKKRQLDIKNIVKSDMPHAFTVIWEEMEINGPQSPKTTMNSGTFTVGRRKVSNAKMRMLNPFGLCVSGFSWGVQP